MHACTGGNVHYIMAAGCIERRFKINTIDCTRFVIVFNEILLVGLYVFATGEQAMAFVVDVLLVHQHVRTVVWQFAIFAEKKLSCRVATLAKARIMIFGII